MNSCCNLFKFRTGGVSPSAITDCSVAHGHNSNDGFQFHPWRFIIHPPKTEMKKPGMNRYQ